MIPRVKLMVLLLLGHGRPRRLRCNRPRNQQVMIAVNMHGWKKKRKRRKLRKRRKRRKNPCRLTTLPWETTTRSTSPGAR